MIQTGLILLSLVLLRPATLPDRPAPQVPAEPAATTPVYPNPSCPIMGKPISTRLFAETQLGRIYICCKSCVKDILEDVSLAYRTAYPAEQSIENKVCPVSGKAITEESPTLALQGFTFFVHGREEIATARELTQITLARLHDPKLVDLANSTCPVNGEPVEKNTIVVIEGTIVRLSSSRVFDEFAKAPAKFLESAKRIRARELEARTSDKSSSDAEKR